MAAVKYRIRRRKSRVTAQTAPTHPTAHLTPTPAVTPAADQAADLKVMVTAAADLVQIHAATVKSNLLGVLNWIAPQFIISLCKSILYVSFW